MNYNVGIKNPILNNIFTNLYVFSQSFFHVCFQSMKMINVRTFDPNTFGLLFNFSEFLGINSETGFLFSQSHTAVFACVMKTGFSLWELTYREVPVSLTGFGFAV